MTFLLWGNSATVINLPPSQSLLTYKHATFPSFLGTAKDTFSQNQIIVGKQLTAGSSTPDPRWYRHRLQLFFKNLIWLKNNYALVSLGAGVICLFPGQMQAITGRLRLNWQMTSDVDFYQLNKSDLLVIHWINVHIANMASKMCLLESTEEIICMFLLAPLCVDWQMCCLSYSVMFACQHSFFFFFLFGLVNCLHMHKIPKTKQVLHCSRTFHTALEQLDQTLPSRHMNSMKRSRL